MKTLIATVFCTVLLVGAGFAQVELIPETQVPVQGSTTGETLTFKLSVEGDALIVNAASALADPWSVQFSILPSPTGPAVQDVLYVAPPVAPDPIQGDANHDGAVNITDLIVVFQAYFNQ